MAANIKSARLDLYDDDGIGPVKCALGVGQKGGVLRGRIPRAKWLALMGDLKRIKGETLPGSLDALCPVAEEP